MEEGSELERARRRAGSFAERFEPLRADVLRLCRRLLGPGPAAEDAASEVFLRARRAFESYDPGRPFRPWLLGVAGHLCIDRIRRAHVEALLFDARDLDPGELPEAGPSPLGHLLAAEERAAVTRAIETLPARYRLPLVLRYFAELDYAGMAELLGVKPGQVGSLLFRARRRLRAHLLGDTGGATP
jgi:RNA polymerase sigma-70 factor (ECF subfamily)